MFAGVRVTEDWYRRLCFWKKNLNVLSRPITSARPEMNRVFPIASSPLSKTASYQGIKRLHQTQLLRYQSSGRADVIAPKPPCHKMLG